MPILSLLSLPHYRVGQLPVPYQMTFRKRESNVLKIAQFTSDFYNFLTDGNENFVKPAVMQIKKDTFGVVIISSRIWNQKSVKMPKMTHTGWPIYSYIRPHEYGVSTTNFFQFLQLVRPTLLNTASSLHLLEDAGIEPLDGCSVYKTGRASYHHTDGYPTHEANNPKRSINRSRRLWIYVEKPAV